MVDLPDQHDRRESKAMPCASFGNAARVRHTPWATWLAASARTMSTSLASLLISVQCAENHVITPTPSSNAPISASDEAHAGLPWRAVTSARIA